MTTTPQSIPATLVIERTFAHSPEKLWRALTESQLLAQWLMNNDFESTVSVRARTRWTCFGRSCEAT